MLGFYQKKERLYLRYDYKKTRKNQRMCPARLGGWMGTYAH